MVDNIAESANIQALFHSTELTGVEAEKKRQEIGNTDSSKIIDHQEKGNNMPMLNPVLADLYGFFLLY